MRFILLIYLINSVLLGCRTTNDAGYLAKSEYKETRLALQAGKYKKAAKNFPAKKSTFFIPTLEYAWISLLNGKRDVDMKKLIAMSQTLEDAKLLRVEDEARRFFFKELDEYYVPAEHEIVMFHLITGLLFAKQEKFDKVRVEAKRAAYYLPGSFINKDEFDDPGIRLLLASLWLMCDEWQQARSNLLKASKLSKKYAWAGKLAVKRKPPKNFILALRGVGPEVVWQPQNEESGRWGLNFVFEDKKQKLKVASSKGPIPLGTSGTAAWYKRHFDRDTIPRTALDNFNRTTKVIAGSLGAVVVTTLAVVGATIIVAGAVAATVSLVVLAGRSDSSALMQLAVKVSGSMLTASLALAQQSTTAGTAEAVAIYDDFADESENYRFARFLPSYIHGGAKQGSLARVRLKGKAPLLDVKKKNHRVLVFFTSGKKG